MIMPNISPVYYADQDQGLIQRKESFYTQCLMINQSFQSQADIDMQFYVGEQSALASYNGYMPINQRKQFFFNRVRRAVDMVSGYQRKNRKTTVVVPVENASQAAADDFTKALLWNDAQEGVLETISDCFQSTLCTGMSLMRCWLDFRSDPVSGNLKVDKVNYNDFIIDPYFRKPDLSDCNGIIIRNNITALQALSLFPGREDEILSLNQGDTKDGKFILQPENRSYGPKNYLNYDEFYYRDFRKATMLIDTQTGETLEWRGNDGDALKYYLQQFPQIIAEESEIPTISCDIFIQDRVMYHGPHPLGIDRYGIVPVLGYYHPEISDFVWRCQGMVRGMRDAQALYNRRKVIELDILESQINSGFKYKENALVNPSDVFLNGQGKGLALKASAQMTDVEQILPPQIPQSMIALSESLAREVQEISGVNEELLGSATDDKVGILAQLRQGAGLVLLQRLFDQLDYAQKLLGSIRLEVIQNNFTPGKMANILQHDPSEQFYNKNFGRFDCVIEEGMYTSTQKQMQFAQMLQLKEAGVPISDQDLLEASTFQNKDEIIERMQKQQEQQQQMAQQQQQAELQLSQANARLLEANAKAAEGIGIEKQSRVLANIAQVEERRNESFKDFEQGKLNKAKAIKELEGIDLAHLRQLLEMATMVDQSAMKEKEANAMKPEEIMQAAPQESPMQPQGAMQ